MKIKAIAVLFAIVALSFLSQSAQAHHGHVIHVENLSEILAEMNAEVKMAEAGN